MVTTADGVRQAGLADAATALAGRVLDALHGDGEVDLAGYLDASADPTAALGAVRLIGADVFAAHVLLRRPLEPDDASVVAESFAVFPPSVRPVTPDRWVVEWRDWATRRLAARLAGTPFGGPGTAPAADRVPATLGEAAGWQPWSVRVAQLSPLALPDLGGPVTAAVLGQPHALAMGTSRATLRRDHVTAARLVRWLALLAATGSPVPLDPALLVRHLALHAGSGARLLLDLAIARHLLRPETA